jgi:protocatechuate 3,4-dioxygenase beta subunit
MGSRRTLPLLVVLLLLVVGVLAILYSGGGGSDGDGAGIAATSLPGPAADESGQEVTMVSSEDLGGDPPEAARTLVETSGDQGTVAGGPSPDAPPIRGRVVDKRGNGIGGATLWAGSRGLGPLDAEDSFRGDERWKVETETDGSFELFGPHPGRLRLAVRAAGFAPWDRNDLTLPAGDELELEPIFLSQGAILSGRVVDPDGRGIPGAELQRTEPSSSGGFVYFGRSRGVAAITDEQGAFRIDQLACGAWKLVVTTEDFPDRTFEGTADEPGREQAGLLFQLLPGDSIAGHLEGIPENSTEELLVRARPVAGEDRNFAFVAGATRTAEIAPDGSFEVKGLTVGTDYRLHARTIASGEMEWWGGRSRSEPVQAKGGERGVVLHYMPEAVLLFQVVSADGGAPLTDFQVDVGVNWSRPLQDEDGKRLEHHPEGRVRAGDLRPDEESDRIHLTIRAVGFREIEREDIQLAAGQELDLGQFLLEPVPVVRVTVLDDVHGGPIEGARVVLEKQPDPVPAGQRSFSITMGGEAEEGLMYASGGDAQRGVTDEEGVAVLTSIEGETCLLTITADGYAKQEVRNLVLPLGEDFEQRVRVRRGGDVVVEVRDANGELLAGTRVEHRSPSEAGSGRRMVMLGGPATKDVTDSEGEVLFANLETGIHSFRLAEEGGSPFGGVFESDGAITIGGSGLSDEEETWWDAEVVEGEIVWITLVAAPRGSLTGRVREAGIPLAGATLRLAEKSAGSSGNLGMLFAGLGGGGNSARSDGDGFFEFPDLKTGRYTLSVEHPSRHMDNEFVLHIDAGENRFDVEVPVCIIEGRITDPQGEPLAGVRVEAERHRPDGPEVQMRSMVMMVASDGEEAVQIGGGDGGGDRVTTDEDGRYRLRGVLPDIDLVVRASGPGVQDGSSEPLTLAPDQTEHDVDFTLFAAGKLRVEALAADGAPARFLSVTAEFLGEDAENVDSENGFIESGSTLLDGIRPGIWRVSVEAMGGMGTEVGAAEPREVEVKADEEASVTFHLE